MQLDADVALMVRNAQAYNDNNSQVYHDATTLQGIYADARSKHFAGA